jgi:hypothetical protein
MFVLVSLSLVTLTEVLENDFLLPLMQEAWCRSWRQCVQTLLPYTRPSPSGGAFGALVCRKEFLLSRGSHSPRIIEQPEAQTLWCNSDASFYFPWEQLCLLQGRVWFRRAKTTADTWLGGSPDFLSLKKMLLLLVFVCLLVCFFILWKIFIQTSFYLLGQNRIGILKLCDSSLPCFLKQFCWTVFY